ncbi:hypothetical protein C0033_00870 [Clostridium sp. chh4-2]|uniref:hypothetical protein n=1 Tax=Clostridium sp. chh4-2 TaxID=2067550 RepID=UPI000CCE5A78|nr:hypothetical protein [Clostridium sp. chh4-2]PNV63915.1 hypothetical protein C0033_00870 [Clostridium sp. chh4-2]
MEKEMKNFRKILAMMAAFCMLLSISTPITAKAAEGKLVVEGNVTLSGGNGNIEDVLITIKHGYMTDGPVVGTGHPDANGHYSIETTVSSYGFLALIVKPELAGYDNYSPSSNIYPGQNSADLLLIANGTPTTFSVSGAITMNGAALPYDLCPIVNFEVPATSGHKELQACGGNFNCNGLAGNKVIITPHLEGYSFTPESITIEKIDRSYNDANFVMTKNEVITETPEIPETPETPENNESTKNTVTLYFMTGSSPSEPGEVFEQFEVAKNSRGNTTTLAKTIKSRVPSKDGYKFNYWQEAKLSDPSVLGNQLYTVIWTNDTDQYIYAQYTKVEEPETSESNDNTVTLYFMTGSSPSDPGEVFEHFKVAKNSRGNTTTLAKTIKSSVPSKDGYTFNYWQEAKLSDPSVLGNRLYTVIWTNDTDQYIYAQYK